MACPDWTPSWAAANLTNSPKHWTSCALTGTPLTLGDVKTPDAFSNTSAALRVVLNTSLGNSDDDRVPAGACAGIGGLDCRILIPVLFALAFLIASSAFLRNSGPARSKPREVPLLGAIPDYLLHYSTIFDYVTGMLENCSTMTYSSFLPGQGEVVTANPDNIRHILKDAFGNYPKGPNFQENFEDLLGHGIFNSDGEQWRSQRKAASLVFSTNSLRSLMLTSIQEELQSRLLPTLQQAADLGGALDIQDVLLRYTFDNICRIGFGVDLGCLAPGFPEVPFARAFDSATKATMLRNLLPPFLWRLMRLLGIGSEGRLRAATKVIRDFVQGVIETRQHELRQHRTSSPTATATSMQLQCPGQGHPGAAESEDADPGNAERASTEGSGQHQGRPGPSAAGHGTGKRVPQDLLSRMVSLHSSKEPFAPEGNPGSFLLDACTNFILAGRDTSAVALSWLFWLLAQHPQVEANVLEEIQAIKRNRAPSAQSNDPLSFEELKMMNYTQATINESLRLYPSVPLGCKYALEDDTLPDGTFVAKGSRVLYSMYSTGRMANVWGSDAREFKPERWITATGEVKAETQFRFTAFNAGPRLCLGRDLAYLQMKSAIAAILPRFKVTPQKPMASYQVSLTLFMEGGFPVEVLMR